MKNNFRKSSDDVRNDYYMYSVETSTNSYWFISNKVGDLTFRLAGFKANANCPDGKTKLRLT